MMKPLTLHSETVAEVVPEGGSTTLSVSVEAKGNYFYQWYLQGERILGATSSSLTITNVSTNNIGYYTCYATDGVRLGLSEPIQVLSLTTNQTVTYISARPAPANGGLLGSCPGPYSGYVTFGWVKAIGGSATASATWGACSAIRWDSLYGNGCCLGSSCSLTATANRWYGFTAYFPPGSPPTGTAIYTLQLSGFYP